jgi:hypothetical protein
VVERLQPLATLDLMTVTSERFGFEVPDDFPITLLESVHGTISDPDDERRKLPAWTEWAGACNVVLYRFVACAEHCDVLVSSLELSTSPSIPERYEQEKLVYNFFCEGLSSLECLYYGAYFAGALVGSAQLDPAQDQRDEAAFAGEAVTGTLRAVLDEADHKVWKEVRNVLTHRRAPGREHHEGGPTSGNTYWLGNLLDSAGFSARRGWLSASLTAILGGLDDFASKHLSI